MNVDKEKILKQFESGEIKIALTEEQGKALYDSLPFKQSRAEYEFIKNALEKQIPKKVKNLKKDSDIGACIPETKSGHCPVCDVFLWGEMPYCNYCGQALDWGNNDNESQS